MTTSVPVAVDAETDTAIRHLIAQYAWALDTGDIATLMNLFTDDCVLQDTSGKRHVGKEAATCYFKWLTQLPAFRGRRHHIDNLLYLSVGSQCRTKAYWMVDRWESASERKVMDFVGWSEDCFVLRDGQWRIAERLLHYWRDTDGPWIARPVER